MMGPHKNLQVWQKSLTLARMVYMVTGNFPKQEQFVLVNQMRRCVTSIPSNIAEGYGRCTNKDLVHFLYIALGSSNELDTQLIISHDMGYIPEEEYQVIDQQNEEVNKMLRGLITHRSETPDALVDFGDFT